MQQTEVERIMEEQQKAKYDLMIQQHDFAGRLMNWRPAVNHPDGKRKNTVLRGHAKMLRLLTRALGN